MTRTAITSLALIGHEVEWTTLRRARGALETADTGRVTLDTGDRPDAATWIREEPAAAAAGLKERCPRPRGTVAISLPASCALMRVLTLPSVSRDELQNMAELQVDKFAPFPAENMGISFEVLHQTETSSRVLVVAVQKTIIEAVGQAFRQAGILPHRLDINILGWWSLLRAGHAVAAHGRHIILVLDGLSCDMVIADGEEPILFRSLSAAPAWSADDFANEALQELEYTLTTLELEFGGIEIAGIAVWYRGEAAETLLRRIREDGRWPVTANDLDSLPPMTEALARRAAAGDAHSLDLVPSAWRQAEQTRLVRRRLVLASLGVAALWLLLVGGVFAGYAFDKGRLGRLDAQLEKLRDPFENVRRTRDRVKNLDLYADRKYTAIECLREVSTVLPSGVDLTSFTYKKGKAVALAGETSSVSLIYDFKKALDESSLFRGTELQGPVRDRRGRETFKMNIKLPETPE